MFKFTTNIVIFILLLFYSVRIECQNICIGKYSAYYGEIIFIYEDSTFKYINGYPRHQWAKGIWRTCHDTMYLIYTPVYDTLRVYTSENVLIKESLTLSYDEYPSQINHILTNRSLLPEQDFSVILNFLKQNGSIFPKKLLFRRKKLYEFDEFGKPIITKYRSISTNRKFKSGYSYDGS